MTPTTKDRRKLRLPEQRVLHQLDLDRLRSAGLRVTVRLDLSHNIYMVTFCGGRRLEPKPIHVELELRPAPGEHWPEVLSRIKNYPTRSAAFEVRTLIMPHLSDHRDLHDSGRPLDIEVHRFDTSVAWVKDPVPDSLADALRACRVRTPHEFNSLPRAVRESMGVFERVTSNRGFRRHSPRKERHA